MLLVKGRTVSLNESFHQNATSTRIPSRSELTTTGLVIPSIGLRERSRYRTKASMPPS